MDLNLISLFVEIVDARSLSAAARKLGMTRANVSQRLKLLERETGAQLLRRSTRSIEMTQAGHTLYDCGQRMINDLGSARASIDDLGHMLRGRVRISVPTGFGRMFIGSRLTEFARQHAGIRLTVTFNNRVEDLIAAEVDVAVRITSAPPLDHVARHICDIEWKLYASAAYLQAHGPVRVPADLDQQTLIASTYSGPSATLTLMHRDNDADFHTVTMRPTLQSSDYPFLTDAVCAGIGVGLLPVYVSHAAMSKNLLPVLPHYRVTAQQNALYIITLPNRYPSPSTQALIDYLRSEIAEIAQAWA